MSRLAGYPSGLLDLLGSQSFGEAPRDLSDVIVPQVDLTALYLLTKRSASTRGTFNLANGFNGGNDIAVPQGEVWQLQAASYFVTAGVGGAAEVQPMVLVDGNGMAIGPRIVYAANQTYAAILDLPAPLWLKAGDRIVTWCTGVAGAPTCSITVCAAKFRA